MRVLALDTATDTCSIALQRDGALAGEDTFAAGRMHLEMLLPQLQALLEACRLQVSDLDALIVGTGPGTFSGLRVGMATARGLAQGLEAPLVGAGSLEALACGIGEAAPDAANILAVIDAKRAQVFSRLFRRCADGSLAATGPVSCQAPDRLVESVGAGEERPLVAAGNGLLAYSEIFAAAPGIEPLAADHPAHQLRARFHFAALDNLLNSGEGTGAYSLEKLSRVLPTYIREPDADLTVLERKKEPWLR